ncbi:MAG TPA: hypothetical protein VFM48_06665 [Aquabacterium sp.]|nr:hypothetical protein [Aquabacterium sp.]
MTQLLRQISVGSKFAAQFGGVLTLSAISVAALSLTGSVKVEWAHPQLAGACLAASGLAAGAWAWWVGRSASKPLKQAVELAQSLSESTGPSPFAVDRGDEASRLMRHLSHVQEQHERLAKAYDALQATQEDQQEEMAHWMADTLRMRSALDAAGLHALITDEHGVILFVTKSLARMLKEHQSQIKAVLPQVDLGRLVGHKLEAFAQAADGAALSVVPTSDIETELRFAGLTFLLKTQAIRDRKGQMAGHVVVWRDLSHATPAQLPDATSVPGEQVWRQVIDVSATPTYLIDPSGQIKLANTALQTILAQCATAFKAANPCFQHDQVVGASVGMFYADPDTALKSLSRLTERRCQRMVLGGRTYDVIETPLLDDAGALLGVVGQWMDCTDVWLAERAFQALAHRVAEGDYSKPANLEGIAGALRNVGQSLNTVVSSVHETLGPVRLATEQLGNALAHISQSTLSLQQVLDGLASRTDADRIPKPSLVLAEKAGALLAQMVPAINHTSEILQDPMSPNASDALATTAEQLQAQAALLQAMVASYRLAVGSSKSRNADDGARQTALAECTS